MNPTGFQSNGDFSLSEKEEQFYILENMPILKRSQEKKKLLTGICKAN